MDKWLLEQMKRVDLEIKHLRDLNKTQGQMILRRNQLIDDIHAETSVAAKGTVLEGIKRRIEVFKKRKGQKGWY